ncbi:unnamed protein product [Rangifer tarandus platyrhynchus]|uniref:Uncharacterized protein n=1 Tax=Rangifer tarandus platyrhynchus TaxID=3082113 RepID=A0AC60A6M9_RANTA
MPLPSRLAPYSPPTPGEPSKLPGCQGKGVASCSDPRERTVRNQEEEKKRCTGYQFR